MLVHIAPDLRNSFTARGHSDKIRTKTSEDTSQGFSFNKSYRRFYVESKKISWDEDRLCSSLCSGVAEKYIFNSSFVEQLIWF